jgi:type II secretory pathway component PulF
MSGYDPKESERDPQPVTVGSAVVSAAVMVLVHGLVGVAVCLFFLFIVPGYKRTYQDFQMKPPMFTEWVVALSDAIGENLFVLLPLALVLLLVDGAVLYLLRRKRQTRPLSWAWFAVLLLLPLSAWLVGWWGVWLANLKLQEGLSR